MKLKVKRWHVDAKVPEIAHPGEDFGYDVFACLTEDENAYTLGEARYLTIKPGQQVMIPIGWAMEIEPGPLSPLGDYRFGLIAKQPSGLASKRKLDVKAGVIDAGYRNQIQILLYNYGTEPQYIQHHEKIAQLVPMPVFSSTIEEVNELSESDRGTAGWGSGHKA